MFSTILDKILYQSNIKMKKYSKNFNLPDCNFMNTMLQCSNNSIEIQSSL